MPGLRGTMVLAAGLRASISIGAHVYNGDTAGFALAEGCVSG